MSNAMIDEGATVAKPGPQIEVDPKMQQIFEHLAEEGFRPQIDEDETITFKFEGWKLFVDAYASNGGFRLLTCAQWELNPCDRTIALSVVNSLNLQRRCVKASVNEKNTVWISYETHCADPTEYSRTLADAAEFLVSACKEYRSEFHRESQPVTLNS